jgi:hypothetical protein
VILSSVLLKLRLLLVGKINVRVDKYGAIRIFTTEGTDTIQHINRISVMAAGNPYQVIEYWNDLQVNIPTSLVSSPILSDYEVTGTYDNTYSGVPPDFLFEQNVYGWNNQSYCVAKCLIKNQETVATPILAGLDIIQYVVYRKMIKYIISVNVDTMNTLCRNKNTFEPNYDKFPSGMTIMRNLTQIIIIGTWASFDTDTLVTDADGG